MNPMQSVKPTNLFGFTLVELMITLVVLGIITTIALPSFQNFTLNQKVKTAAYDLYTTMLFARGEAVKDGANVTITPDTGGWQDGWTITNASGTTLRTESGYSSIDISSTSNSLIFQKSGRPNISNTVTFTLDVSGNSYVIKRCLLIDPGGLPKLLVDNNQNGNCYDG